MKESNIYLNIWDKYRPVIISKMKLAIQSPQEYKLSKHEFESLGKRLISGYTFNLEITDGKLSNNIDGTAVARDLFEVLKNSPTAKGLMQNNLVKISLTKDFTLRIQIQPLA